MSERNPDLHSVKYLEVLTGADYPTGYYDPEDHKKEKR